MCQVLRPEPGWLRAIYSVSAAADVTEPKGLRGLEQMLISLQISKAILKIRGELLPSHMKSQDMMAF